MLCCHLSLQKILTPHYIYSVFLHHVGGLIDKIYLVLSATPPVPPLPVKIDAHAGLMLPAHVETRNLSL